MNRVIFNFGKIFIVLALAFTFASCGTDTDDNDDVINIPVLDPDEADCCSLDVEEATIGFLSRFKEVEELTDINDSIFTIKVYSASGNLHAGYNDIYFTVIKTKSGRHVKDVEFGGIAPVMTMGSMNNMQHSTPVGEIEKQSAMPLYHTWVSFLMPSSEEKKNTWDLSFRYSIKGVANKVSNKPITVEPLSGQSEYIKSFKIGDKTYFASLVNPSSLKTGVNSVKAYISEKSEDIKNPYQLSGDVFTIEIVPTMPDMGNHTSPNNEAMLLQDKGYYQGKLNLTMTGRWDIHLVIKDNEGNIVAGAENDDSGYSKLYWQIEI